MSHMAICLFGSFGVSLDGRPLTTFKTDKTRALLAYLAVEAARAHRREVLAAMFWSHRPMESARNNLRQTLYRLRRAIGDQKSNSPHLAVTFHDVQLDPKGDHWLDATAFKAQTEAVRDHHRRDNSLCKACRDRLVGAIALYQGDFLAGFSLPDSPQFDWWLLARQEYFHRQTLQALDRLSRHYELIEDYGRAASCAQREIELEPWRESAHRRGMRALALSGQRCAALRKYDACRQILATELEAEPVAATTSLYEKIRDGTFGSPHVPNEKA